MIEKIDAAQFFIEAAQSLVQSSKEQFDAGQLTQAQADAISAQGQQTLWQTINQNATTNKTIQSAQNTLQQAKQTMNETLSEAGITVNSRDNGMNSNMPGPGGNRQSMGDNGNEQEGPGQQADD